MEKQKHWFEYRENEIQELVWIKYQQESLTNNIHSLFKCFRKRMNVVNKSFQKYYNTDERLF